MNIETHKIKKLLQTLIEMAEEDGLSGAYRGDATSAVRRYNGIVDHLEDEDVVPDGIFDRLDANATFPQLATEARLLMSYLDDGEDRKGKRGFGDFGALLGIAPFAPKEDLGRAVQSLIERGEHVDAGLIAGLAPFLDRDTVGVLLKLQLGRIGIPPAADPKAATAAPQAPEPTRAPQAPQPVRSPGSNVPASTGERTLVRDSSEELMRLSTELARPDLTPQRRAEIAVELSKLAHEQAVRSEAELG